VNILSSEPLQRRLPALLANSGLKKLASSKQTSLLQTFGNDGCKKFYNIGPRHSRMPMLKRRCLCRATKSPILRAIWAAVRFNRYSVVLKRNCMSQFSNSGERTQTEERSKLPLPLAMIAKIKNVQKRSKLFWNFLTISNVLKTETWETFLSIENVFNRTDNKINRLSRRIIQLIHKYKRASSWGGEGGEGIEPPMDRIEWRKKSFYSN